MTGANRGGSREHRRAKTKRPEFDGRSRLWFDPTDPHDSRNPYSPLNRWAVRLFITSAIIGIGLTLIILIVTLVQDLLSRL